MALLLDTHVWAWSLTGTGLSPALTDAIDKADNVYISPISLFEIGQKVRLGKWPQMEPYVDSLPDLLTEQGGRVAALTPQIALRAASLDWDHRDPFDRILAATCLVHGWPLASVDTTFDTMNGLVRIG